MIVLESNADKVRRYRTKHPDRARLTTQISAARSAAAIRVASRHYKEYEAEIQAECKRRNIPRFLPPLSRELDGRGHDPRGQR